MLLQDKFCIFITFLRDFFHVTRFYGHFSTDFSFQTHKRRKDGRKYAAYLAYNKGGELYCDSSERYIINQPAENFSENGKGSESARIKRHEKTEIEKSTKAKIQYIRYGNKHGGI